MSRIASVLPAVLLAFASILPAAGAALAPPPESQSPIDAAPAPPKPEPLPASVFGSLRLRGIGPALTSGRVSDFAVDPANPARYFAAVASGGVWKTVNAGTTWEPVFDGEGSYSIGCLAMDPRNPSVVWVGTGENNSQRSVGFGDGVYRTRDGGSTWENLGLKESEHIGMIAIHPRDPDTVYVAAQGPLWRSGGDRGLYKTTDGGATWERILHVSDDTGVNEVHLDPRDPDVIYASSYQRRRHVWTLINGGPESAIYKSTDGGRSFRKITRGLPGGDLGRIGLDVAPANPDVLYAIVEAAEERGGFYRSLDRGETWEKRSSYMTTSPQYYNEIVCDPRDVDRVYALDTLLQVTEDGGRTFSSVPRRNRHVDDHALWIDPHDTDYLLVGCDGGVYDSHDRGESWDYKPNLPVTQFYKVAVDTSEPFYLVYGGTQDNNTLGGPSRTKSPAGITNEDWFVTVGGDGFETQVDPEDPNVVYSQSQHGNLVRYDRRSGEELDIQPQEQPDEEPNRWNWDSPLLISPHDPKRLYFGSQRLYRSDDGGLSWTAISGDLTRRLDRNALEVMGRIQPVNAVAKHDSTSFFGNTVALDESPLLEGLIYVGTDDGLVQVTEDGGEHWRTIRVFPVVPDMTYVSDLCASRHDADTVFATFDNHKNGDFTPYILRSTDRGETWESIAGDLPERNVVYALSEDHENPDLLFVGAEFGAYVTADGGAQWVKLRGMPTIAVRDVEIQRRESDLVLATFGRGFYVLDDYTPLRLVTREILDQPAHIFPIKPALRYVETSRLGGGGRGSQGASFYAAPNPPFGAVFTYHVKETTKTRREKREEASKKPDAPYPTIDELRAEEREREPVMFLTVRDDAGNVVRRIAASRQEGMHRETWDLRYPAPNPISAGGGDRSPWGRSPSGPLAPPGTYTVELSREIGGEVEILVEPREFEVVPLDDGTFPADDPAAVLAFQAKVARLQRAVLGALRAADEAETRLASIRKAIIETPAADPALLAEVNAIDDALRDLLVELRGDPVLGAQDEPQPPSIRSRVQNVVGGQWSVTSPPTATQRANYDYAAEAFAPVLDKLRALVEEDLPALDAKLEEAGAPWTPGRLPDWRPETTKRRR